jgi:two-component system CheB/CheR fusion protein
MAQRRHSVLRGFLVPVLATAAAGLIRLALGPLLGDTIPFLTFYPAVALSAWFGGLRAGLLATVLGAALAPCLFQTSLSVETLLRPAMVLSVGLFAFVGVLLSWLTHERSRSEASVRAVREAERHALQTAQAAAERVGRLQQITAALANALTTDQVADVIMMHALTAFGANAGVVAVLSDDGEKLVCVGSAGYPPEAAVRYARVPVSESFALADAVRRREPVILETAAERFARYPHHATLRAAGGDGAGVALPLLLKDHAVGALGLSFPRDRAFPVEEVNFLFTVARQCAQALDRARSYEAEGQARARAEQEVAGRKRVEAALELSERAYREMFESNPQPMWVFDRDTLAILAVNDAAVAHYGYHRDEFLALSVRDLRPPGEAPGPPAMPPPRESGAAVAVPRRHRKKDGTVLVAEVTVHPVLFAGRPAALSLAHDVTERVRATEALREGAERLRLALETGRLGSWELDAARGVLTCSAPGQVHFGLPPGAEYPFETFFQVIHPDDRARVRGALDRARAGQADCDAEYRCVWPDGSVRWLMVRGRGVADPAGEAAPRLVGVSIDVTERKLLEAELRQRAEQLAEADRKKDEFLATLAHELRNPLAPIRTALEILRLGGGADSGEMRAVLDRQVGHLVRLVDDLLDVSRITRGKVELRKQRLELAAVVTTAVETSRPLIAEAGHALTVTLPPGPVHLDADQTRLAQVLANLLNNSARYTPRGGHIWLTAEAADAELVVRVKDTGVGIPPAMLPRIFDMFTQVNRTLERSQGGLGIGLTLVKRLVELHGGRVEAHSAGAGQGSEFVVRLPRAAAPSAPENGHGDGTADPTAGPRRRVLVVDDNADAAECLAVLLRLAGHDVCLAPDGPSALDAAAAYRPEVVLLDIGLPGLSGHDVARQLRAAPEGRELLIVAVSGWGQEDDHRRSEEAGFDHHLVKPVDPDALRRLVAGRGGRKVTTP